SSELVSSIHQIRDEHIHFLSRTFSARSFRTRLILRSRAAASRRMRLYSVSWSCLLLLLRRFLRGGLLGRSLGLRGGLGFGLCLRLLGGFLALGRGLDLLLLGARPRRLRRLLAVGQD